MFVELDIVLGFYIDIVGLLLIYCFDWVVVFEVEEIEGIVYYLFFFYEMVGICVKDYLFVYKVVWEVEDFVDEIWIIYFVLDDMLDLLWKVFCFVGIVLKCCISELIIVII